MSQDLSKGKIYKITNDYNDDVYVGSTCDTLVKRFSCHKSNINNSTKMNRPLYVLMREIGTDRFRVELIEDYPSEDKYQLRQREGFFIRQFGTLNKRIECRTSKEYYTENANIKKEYQKEYSIENADRKQQYDKQYRIENADKIKEYQKEYFIENIDKIKEYKKEYNIENANKIKEYQKEYCIENADIKKQYDKQYRIDNVDKFKEKIICECGCEVVKITLKRHQKSKKHLSLIYN